MCHQVYKVISIFIYLTGHLFYLVTDHTPPIIFSSSYNASSIFLVGNKAIYSYNHPGCHGLHIINPIANVMITDVLIVKQNVIFNRCGTFKGSSEQIEELTRAGYQAS